MPLRDKLPSTGALFIFEAAARHRNFTHAANEFNVTQPAVSRAIGALERRLGFRLFDRRHGRLDLTDEGRRLQAAVQGGFAEIELAIDDMTRNLAEAKLVTLSVTSALALHWLMPRFADLQRALPDIALRFELIHGEPYGPLAQADIGIRHAARPGPGVSIRKLSPEMIVPVCSPDYLRQHGPIDAPSGLTGHTLGVLTGPMRVPWDRFLDHLGYAGARDGQRVDFSDYALLLQAAVKGQCVALGWWHVVEGLLATGDLETAGSTYLRSQDDYQIVARGTEGQIREPVRLVMDWFLEQFADTEERLVRRGLRAMPLQTSASVDLAAAVQ